MQRRVQERPTQGSEVFNASDVAKFKLYGLGLDLKEDWLVLINERYPDDLSSLPVEQISFIPSPASLDVPLLATTAHFIDNNIELPLAFRKNFDAGLEKLFELAAFNGKLLLARLRLAMDRGRRFDEHKWRERIEKSICLRTIDRIFWHVPKGLLAPIPASAFPMTANSWKERERARVRGVADWIINEARTLPREEVVTPVLEILPSAHESVRAYINAIRLKPLLPDLTSMFTDLSVARRSSSSAAAKSAANATLRPFLEQLRKILRELGEDWSEAMMVGTWRKVERQLVEIALAG